MGALALAFAATFIHADSFSQTNLVSDVPGLAANTDPNLKNPWGVAFSATSPFWTSDQVTGLATLYNAEPPRDWLSPSQEALLPAALPVWCSAT